MMPQRMPRIESLIQREIGAILEERREEIERDLPGLLLTITKVSVARNLESARAGYSWTASFDAPDRGSAVARYLEVLAPAIIRMLASRVRLKRLPRLIFVHDHGFESADRVYKILRGLGSGPLQGGPPKGAYGR